MLDAERLKEIEKQFVTDRASVNRFGVAPTWVSLSHGEELLKEVKSLVEEVKARDNIISDLRQDSPFTSQAEQVREIMKRRRRGVALFADGWGAIESMDRQDNVVGLPGCQEPFEAILKAEKWTQEQEAKLDTATVG